MEYLLEKFSENWSLHGKFLFYHVFNKTGRSDQLALAMEFGVSKSLFNRWLTGKHRVTPTNLDTVAEFIFGHVEPLVEKNQIIEEFKESFRYLEKYQDVGCAAEEIVPDMAREFLLLLGLTTETGMPIPSKGNKDIDKSDADQNSSRPAIRDGIKSQTRSVGQLPNDETKTPTGLADHQGQEHTKDRQTPRAPEPDTDNSVRGAVSVGGTAKPRRKIASFIACCVTAIAAVLFCALPVFSDARVVLAEHLSGTVQAQNVTHHTQFDREQKGFFGDLLTSLGFLILMHEDRRGSSRATHQLGMAKLLGINTEKDVDTAVSLFKKGHDAGYDRASHSYAYSLDNGLGATYDPQEALAIYEELSGRDVAQSVNSLGQFYQYGIIKPYNPLLALELYRKAEALGEPFATYNIGKLLRDGVPGHIDQDTDGAKRAFAEALEKGVEAAASALAWLYIQNGEINKAIELLDVESRSKNTSAMTYFARQLWSGKHIPRDLERARALFEDAAARGRPFAAFQLAEFIEDVGPDSERERIPGLLEYAGTHGGSVTLRLLGYRAEHDPDLIARAKIAENLYQRASDLGDGRAAYRLSGMILDGRLPERPRQDAIDLLERSVSRGDPYAQWKLATILLDEEVEPTNRADGIEMLRNAGERGDGWVTNMVGVAFANGQIVEQDDFEASAWYKKAFERGGSDWAACNYVRRQLRLNPDSELRSYNRFLKAGTDDLNSNCVLLLFSDFDRLKTWGKSFDELEKILERYVDAGNAQAVWYFAELQSSDLAPPNNPALTRKQYFELLVRAAQGGSVEAMLQLGKDAFSWESGNDDPSEAFRVSANDNIHWLREAASNGASEAVRHLEPNEFDVEPAYGWFDRLVHKTKVDENAERQFLIGLIFEHGADGVKRDLKSAEHWYSLAARTIDDARIRLSRLLVEGCHSDPDYETAIALASSIEDYATREKVYEALHLLGQAEINSRGLSGELQTFTLELRARASDVANWVALENYRIDPRCKEIRLAHLDAGSGLEFVPLSPIKPAEFRTSPLDVLYPYLSD